MEERQIQERIDAYKRKYYLNFLLRGVLISVGLLLFLFLFYILIESLVHAGSGTRAFLFYSYLLIISIVFTRLVFLPFVKLFYKAFQISNDFAAGNIGNHFPNVKDKLLNIIQLSRLRNFDPLLVRASIKQKSGQLGDVNFTKAIDLLKNRKYLIYLLVPFALVILTSLISPGLLKNSTERIIYYNKDFPVTAPFQFIILNDELRSFKNEDFILEAKIEGPYVPDEVYIISGEKQMRLIPQKEVYSYTFRNPTDNIKFNFEAAGYNSDEYTLVINNRPNIKNFIVLLKYPNYLARQRESFNNIGNFQIPEGTVVRWDFETTYTDSVRFIFEKDSIVTPLLKASPDKFHFEKRILSGDDYEIILKNNNASNKDKIKFHIDVISDEYPTISLTQYQDTVLYQFLIIGGNINDDYGFTDLRIYYRDTDKDHEHPYRYINIPLTSRTEASQNFYFHWNLDSLRLDQADQLEYFVQIRDNDGIHGPKASKTGTYLFKIPGKEEMRLELAKSSQNTENQLDKSLQEARKLQQELDELDNRLKGKRQLDWQDKKMIEDILKNNELLEESIRKLRDLNKANTLRNERFGSQNEKLMEKAAQLQQLLDEMLDEETKSLVEELKRLLEENKDLDQVRDMLDKMDFKGENLLNDLERTVELLKRMKYDNKLDEVIGKIDESKNEQDSLSGKTEDKKNPTGEIAGEQEKLNQEFQEIQKEIENLLDLNQDLKMPNPVENTLEEENSIKQEQQNALENLEEGDRKNAAKSQKNAAKQMDNLQAKMEKMQAGGEMNMMMENLNDLRNIIDNLVKLSFNQENLMVEIRKINLSDPRFNELSQTQVKLKDDAKIIEDSLLSLASRVAQISSFVTRKVNEMNQYIDQSTEALKERRKPQAAGLQQFAMTSMNDLALLLDDVMSSMQAQLAMMMGMPAPSNQKGKMPGELSEMQEMLNRQIDELKKSGKSGQSLSEELAKLAAEQERIRNMLQEEKEKGQKEKSGNGSADDIIKKMEQTELDLVNKNLTQQLINRQKEIVTRLLESEKAMREQELDNEREAERAKSEDHQIPPELADYLKLKNSEVELLKTVPPKLNQYYKKEVNEYFKRIQTSSY
ncbi:MAG TPA: hypothetical protein VI583_07180 [Cyclobacteriaceae bacterium]|nr:hypothetical protein [Cyclobacteriaceae bacterium]